MSTTEDFHRALTDLRTIASELNIVAASADFYAEGDTIRWLTVEFKARPHADDSVRAADLEPLRLDA